MNASPLRRKFAATVAFLVIAAAGVLATESSASAWVYQPVVGSRGNVTLPTVMVADPYDGARGHTNFTFLTSTGPTVYRSPAASGTQKVLARYIVERWNGFGWVQDRVSPAMTGWIGAGQTGVVMNPMYLEPTTARGYFRTTWAFDWYSSTGATLGSTYVLTNQASDHRCVTTARFCVSYADYVRTGGYLTNSW